MSYPDIEASTDGGSPITLFEFRYGNGGEDVFRYATTVEPLVAAGRIWQPYNIKHGDIVSAGSLDRAELLVTTPIDIPLTQIFIVTPPSREVLLNIWRGHALADGFDDFIRIWTGRVLTPTWGESELSLACEPIATSAKRIGLRRYYQYGCGHVLYGTMCRVDKAAYTSTGTISRVVDAQTVEVQLETTPADFAHLRLVAGTFRHDPTAGIPALRTITGVSLITGGIRMRLMSAIPSMRVGAPVTMSYGCKHNWNACVAFNNTENYGGFPNIPTKDPYRTNTF